MKKELFKELNAHIRACDSKSLVVNSGYVAVLLFMYSDKSTNVFLATLLQNHQIDQKWFSLLFLTTVATMGYIVLFVQFWFRGWKVHYLGLLHAMYQENRKDIGDIVPIWMKSRAELTSFDNLFRMVPFFVNLVVVLQFTYIYAMGFDTTFFVIFALLIVVTF